MDPSRLETRANLFEFRKRTAGIVSLLLLAQFGLAGCLRDRAGEWGAIEPRKLDPGKANEALAVDRHEAPRDVAGASASDAEAYGRFCRALLERGVYPPASQFEAWFPSLAHDEESIELTLAAAAEAFEQALA